MATITSFQSGDWHTGSTWVGGVVPDGTCDVVIAAGHIVTVNAATTITAKSLTSTGGMVEILDGSGVTVRIDSIVAGEPVKRPDLSHNCLIYVASLSAGQTITIIADSIIGGDTGASGPAWPRAVLSYVTDGAWVLRSDNLSHTVLQGGLTGPAFALYNGTSQCTFDFTAEVIQSLGGSNLVVQINSGNSMTWSGDISGNMYCSTLTGVWHTNVTGITTESIGGPTSIAIGALDIRSPGTGTLVQHEVYGNITGGSGAYAVGIRTSGNTRVYIYGDIKAGTGVEAYGVYAYSHTSHTKQRVFQGYGFDLLNANGELEENAPYTAINKHVSLLYNWFITAEVESIADLIAIEAAGLMLGKFVQVADISGEWDGYTPIGSSLPFAGEYNGYDYISGNAYKIIGPSYAGFSYDGLFGRLSGTVENVQIVGLDISSDGYAGGLAAVANGATITRCSVRGVLGGDGTLGGLCGGAYYTSFTECYCHVTMAGGNVGLIGYGTNNTFTNCYHTKEGDTNGSYRTETELKDKLKYIDWDFYRVWNIDPEGVINDGYPYLDFRVRKAVNGLYRRIHSLTGLKLTGWNLFKN